MITTMKLIALGLITLLTLRAQAFETLNYDCSVQSLPDISAALNLETNRRINAAINAQIGCDRTQLINKLKKVLANPWVNNLETWADWGPIARCWIPTSQSVYRNFSVFDSPFGAAGILKGVINIGGVYVG